MIEVIPGSKYFWQDAPTRMPTAERYTMLLRWLNNNLSKTDWSEFGNEVETLGFAFRNQEDAVAFKLKFGI